MGPKSTAPFIDLIISECQKQYGAHYDEDFPHILIYSLPTPFYVDKPIDHKKMKEVLCKGLRKLETCGADFIAIPSNSPHVYFDDLKKCVSVPLMNIIDVTIMSLGKKPLKVAMLATRTTMDSKMYQKSLKQKGHQIIENEEWQKQVDFLIKSIKQGSETGVITDAWKKLMVSIKRENVDAVIIACTDLTVLTKGKANRIHFIDSSECLAKAVVKRYLELSQK